MYKSIALLSSVCAAAMAGFGGYSVASRPNIARAEVMQAQIPRQAAWAVAAIGRAEPRNGEVRINALAPGRVVETFVHVNDTVEESEVLVRLDDEDVRYRLVAAEAEAAVRRRERDAQPMTAGREDARKAEDALYNSERTLIGARFELDHVLSLQRAKGGNEAQVTAARKRLADARERIQRDRTTLGTALAKSGLPAPNRLEAAFTASRAEVSVAETMLDRTRIRAPSPGTILQFSTKAGEVVSPQTDAPLIVMGDTSSIRVIAEVDEIDSAKVRSGQSVLVRSDAFPGREFEGKVASLAQSLGPPRIGQRGPRRASDIDVLEVTVTFNGSVPLLTGMKTDVFFR